MALHQAAVWGQTLLNGSRSVCILFRWLALEPYHGKVSQISSTFDGCYFFGQSCCLHYIEITEHVVYYIWYNWLWNHIWFSVCQYL